MTDTTGHTEDALAEIWRDVLGVERVDNDADFFALGGDSLLALKVIGAAAERGMHLTLVDLFRNPTVRGMSSALGSGPEEEHEELLSPEDRALVPDGAERVHPATRLQLGLIYESLLSGGELYHEVVSRVVNRPLVEEILAKALAKVSARHPSLRAGFDLVSFSEAMQVVREVATIPLEIADHRGLAEDVVAERQEQVMTSLALPFDPETAPLIRVHAAALDERSFRFSHAFHHAIMDGWSESLFVSEVVRVYDALLDGGTVELGTPAPAEDYVRLERAALSDTEARAYFEALRPHLGAEPPSATPEFRKIGFTLPSDLTAALTKRSASWGVPLKSLMLVTHAAAVAAIIGDPAPVIGVPVSGRPEVTGADLTIGLFLNYLPLRLALTGSSWREAADSALSAENTLLPYRRFPDSEVRKLLGRRPFDSAFNYVHFHARDDLLESGLLRPEEDMRERAEFPIRVEALNEPRAGGVHCEITVDLNRYGNDALDRLRDGLLTAADRLACSPADPVSLPGAAFDRSET
ncbi:condensation domain-containing protein [Amycolatopsis sp. NPDC057786]|uniref:condensation domain-containing protein n=1 Tax=Amycolatopsis sp. NPDC057786 TaxID=3346250 RepID=UPI00366AA86E